MSQLGGWKGYRVWDWRREGRVGQSWAVLELAPVEGAERLCSGCDQPVAATHDQTVRRIRDLPLFEYAVELWVPRLRLVCPRCGPRLERLDWLDPHARVTRRLAESVARRVVKTSRWLLLRNRENVPDEQVVRLEELLAANKALLTVYLLKGDLKGLWRYRREAWAWKAWKIWKRRALHVGDPGPLLLAAGNQSGRWHQQQDQGHQAGVAYVYRDDTYFFLKN